MAEGVGFEPTIGFPMPVFKTGAFDHSATPPQLLVMRCAAFSLHANRRRATVKGQPVKRRQKSGKPLGYAGRTEFSRQMPAKGTQMDAGKQKLTSPSTSVSRTSRRWHRPGRHRRRALTVTATARLGYGGLSATGHGSPANQGCNRRQFLLVFGRAVLKGIPV